MPPKRKSSAATNRVYKTSTPLQQKRFPARTTRVKYGKPTPTRVPKQETLTQMAFVNIHRPVNEDDVALGIYKEETEEPKNKKRRKTTGDELSPESKYQTQTLTQIGNWSFTTESEKDDTKDDSVYDILSSSPRSKELRRKRASETSKVQIPAKQRSSRRKTAPGTMGPPRTPHRRLDREIPSSESPTTPSSLTSISNRSPLKERSINMPIPFSASLKSQPNPSKLPKLRVEDTFDSDRLSPLDRIPTTPSKVSSPVKSLRWAEIDEIHQIGDSQPSTDSEIATAPIIATPSARLRDEIMDSEDEEEDCEAPEGYASEVDQEEPLQPETCYGEIGLETQKLLESQERLSPSWVEESQVPGEEIGSPEDQHHVDGKQIPDQEIVEGLEGEKTQYMESQRLATQHVRSMASRTKSSDVFISISPENVSKIVDRTKNHEFRRQAIPNTVSRIWIYETAPTRVVKYMAVISAAKRPGAIENEDGAGNAEFNAKDPHCGEFAWEIMALFELADPLPWATIEANEWLSSPPRKPTFVRPAVLDHLMANLKQAIFCQSPSMLELATLSPTDTQEAEEQLLSTMTQYPQLQVAAETSSSQCFRQEDEDNEEAKDHEQNSYKDNEDDQINDENEDNGEQSYFPWQKPSIPAQTHSILSSSQINNHDAAIDEHPLPTQKPYQRPMSLPKESGTQRSIPSFSQAETVDLSQSHTPRHHHITEIIYESPTRPICSSTPISLPTPRGREHIAHESVIPYSMNSSQLLTKSQMLPESLLYDSVPRHPLCIQDSDDDDEL